MRIQNFWERGRQPQGGDAYLSFDLATMNKILVVISPEANRGPVPKSVQQYKSVEFSVNGFSWIHLIEWIVTKQKSGTIARGII